MPDKSDERKQDLSGPDEEALEEHVREMLDVTMPDPAPVPESLPEVPAPTKTKITVTEPEIPSAPKVSAKKSTKKSVPIAVTHEDDKPKDDTPDDLTAAIEQANQQLAGEAAVTAPPVPKKAVTPKTKPKKVLITHFDEEATPALEAEEPTPLPEPAASSEATEPETAPEVPTVEPEVVDPEPEVVPDDQPEPEIEEAPPEVSESPLEPEIESPETDKAVSDIIAAESDELLGIKNTQSTSAVKPSKTAKTRKKRRNPFKSSAFRWLIVLTLLGALIAVGIFPTTRYKILNAAGVRSSASVTVLDQSTEQPLKNAKVTLAGQTVQTDETGVTHLQKLKLGPTELIVEKRAFATAQRSQTLGWGSNPLNNVSLTPTGNQYTFTVTDQLSGKPIGSAEATIGEANSSANDKGEIVLTLDQSTDQHVKVQITAAGYRDETVDLTLSNKQNIAVKLVPAHKTAFISKRSGTYDVYVIDADGKNEKKILSGTGSENDSMVLAPHPTEDVAALISTRDNKRDADGNLLSSVTSINLKDGTTKLVIQGSQIRAVDWIGTRFIYSQVTTATANDPQRTKLMSFDYISGDNRQLAAANYFNDVVSASGKVYYAPSSAFQNGVNLGMFVVHADGSGKQSVFNQEVWNMFRTSYDHLTLAVQQDWYDYPLNGTSANKLSGQPSNNTSRLYIDSPDGKKSLWFDTRDGKGTIVLLDTTNKQEKVLYAKSGLKAPLRWVNNNAVVFRVSNSSETADYIVSIDGGEPRKLTTVTDIKGLDRYTY